MITVESMRFWIFDRTPADNPLEGDLFFSDTEIRIAMQHAAREFNSIPPFVTRVNAACLPDDTNIFFEATAEALYKMKLHSLKRNAFEHRGGNVTVDEDNLKIKGLQELISSMQGWKEAAAKIKHAINIRGYFGSIG